MLQRIGPPHAFFSIKQGTDVTACGLAVADRGYLGIFDVVTNPFFRRQGHARELLRHMGQWGLEHQCHTAFLQVVAENHAALTLYQTFGFTDEYTYWYRILHQGQKMET